MIHEYEQRIIQRLIDTWDDDLGELIRLVELAGNSRRRGMVFERELCAKIADEVAMDYVTADSPSGARAAMEIAKLIREGGGRTDGL